jgi:hypothetical protein
MAAPRAAERLRQQKEAKQKKVLFALIPVLVVVVGVMVVRPMLKSEGPAPVAAADTSAAESSASALVPGAEGATTTPPATTAAPATTAGTTEAGAATTAPVDGAAVPAPISSPAELIDSDLRPQAGEGQLISFGRFVGKDPFQQQIDEKTDQAGEEKPATEAPEATPGEAAPSGEEPAPTEPGTDQPESAPNAVQLTVNGVAETVSLYGSFPAGDPVFAIKAIDKKTVKIGLVTGSFSTGVPTLDLQVGQTLTLVSQPDGIRYVIRILGLTTSSADPEAPSDGGTSDTVPADDAVVPTTP